MLHLFDANVLITASNMYYPLDGVPEFWEWIDHQATNGRIKLPVEILEEVLAGSKKEDPLLDWMTPTRMPCASKKRSIHRSSTRWSPKDMLQT